MHGSLQLKIVRRLRIKGALRLQAVQEKYALMERNGLRQLDDGNKIVRSAEPVPTAALSGSLEKDPLARRAISQRLATMHYFELVRAFSHNLTPRDARCSTQPAIIYPKVLQQLAQAAVFINL